ncbi:MAG: DMT family transporter [Candidatus Bathyarchaeota archaeon]|nr:DMT family transporter [Candidatus Bathyarchaeota archaeon]
MTHHWGYIAVVASAILFGLGTTLNKIVLSEVHPTVVAGLIYLFAGLALSIVRFTPIRKPVMGLLKTPTKTEKKFCRKDVATLGLVALSGSIIAPVLFLNRLNQTTAINASLLQNAESLFTVLIALSFLKERYSRKELGAIAILIVGAIFLTTNGQFNQLSLETLLLGNLFILVACLFWGIDNNLSKFLCIKDDLILVAALKCLIGGVSLLAMDYVLNLNLFMPLSVFPYLLSVGAFSIGFSILFFMLGLKEIGSMRTGAIFSTAALFGAMFAFGILNEPFTAVQVFAGLIMAVGVYFLYKSDNK